MRRPIHLLVVMTLVLGGGLPSLAQPPETIVVADGHFSFTLPSSLKLMDGTYELVEDEGRQVLVVDVSRNEVMAIPTDRGNSDSPPEGVPSAAVQIVTDIGEPGAYVPLGADMSLSQEEAQQLDEQLRTGMTQEAEQRGDMTEISWGGASIIQLPQTYAIQMLLSGRESSSGQVLVMNIFMIQNFDSMYYITLTYRDAETETWRPAMELVMNSLRFQSRNPEQ